MYIYNIFLKKRIKLFLCHTFGTAYSSYTYIHIILYTVTELFLSHFADPRRRRHPPPHHHRRLPHHPPRP